MSITTCTNPWAADFDPNSSSNSPEVTAAHLATHVESYKGCVVELREHNHYDDSDFAALVWDGEKLTEVQYATTRSWTYHNNASVDATPAVRAKVVAWYANVLYQQALSNQTAHNRKEAESVQVGSVVKSLTKRGKNVGVEGVVAWIGTDDFRVPSWSARYQDEADLPRRVGVKVEGESQLRYLPLDRVERADKAPVVGVSVEDAARLYRNARSTAKKAYGSKVPVGV